MECSLQEVMPELNSRSAAGRVVVNPPAAMGSFQAKEIGKIYMCCSRAFLTKTTFEKHLTEKEVHGKPIDFKRTPRSPICGEQNSYERESSGHQWSDTDDDLSDSSANFIDEYGTKNHMLTGETTRFISTKPKMQNGKVKVSASVSIKQAIIARAKRQLIFPNQPYKKRPVGYCRFCNKGFPSQLGLRDHLNTHTGARPYKCEICKFGFSHNSNYKRHIKTAHGTNDAAKCNICESTFTSNNLLVRHLRTLHPNQLRTKKIQSPEKQINLKEEPVLKSSILPNLKLQHPPSNASGRFECHVCNKAVVTPQAWRHHMLIHQNLKPIKCKHCGIYFRIPSTLNNHIKTSHGDGIFRCTKCPCRYTGKNALSRHIRLYHSKKSKIAVRTVVEKLTRDEDDADVVSSPNYPNRQCHLCFKVFTARIPKELHIKRAHGDGRHKCPFCCCRYYASQALFSHLVKEHDMKSSDWDYESKRVKSTAKIFTRNIVNVTEDSTVGEKENHESDETKERGYNQPHEKTETGSYNYACDICNKGFMWRGSVFNHKRKVHHPFNNKFGCPSCPLEFLKKGWLQKHQETVHGFVEPPKILAASTIESSKASSKDDSRRFVKCLMCDKLLTRGSLQAHMVIHNRGDKKLFECNLCKMKFLNPSSIHIHKKKAHLHNGKIKCSQCSCKFMVKAGLIAHRRVFHSRFAKIVDPNFQNSQNNSTGAARSISQQNIPPQPQLNSPTKNESQYQCIQCDQWFSNMNSFRKHVAVHTSGKKFECNMCHLKFAFRSGIRSHKLKSHLHNGRFQCSQCPCKFLTFAGLRNHKKIHHGYVAVKNKKLMTKVEDRYSTLDPPCNPSATVVTHNEQENTSIPTVSKASMERLSNKKNLKTHLITHTGTVKKKYKCELCGLKFRDRCKLPLHKKRAHDHDGKFQCPECSCKFLNAMGLSVHRGSHHKSKPTALVENIICQPETPTENVDAIVPRHEQKVACSQCGFLYFRHTLPLHMKRAHDHDGKFHCPDCSCKFLNALGLSIHRGSHLKTKYTRLVQNIWQPEIPTENVGEIIEAKNQLKIPCTRCSLLFFRHSLPLHMKTSHNHSGKFQCPNCTCKFRNEEGVLRHRVLYHGYKKPEPVRKGTSVSLGLLKKSLHRTADRSKKPAICNICGIKLNRLGYLRQHRKSAHSNGPYKCNKCCCRFHSPLGLVKHTRVHNRKANVLDGVNLESEVVVPPTENTHQTTEDVELTSETGASASNVNRNFLKIQSTSALKRDISKSTLRTSPSRKCLKDLSKDKAPSPRNKRRIECALCGAKFGSSMFYERHMGRAHTGGKYECGKCPCTFHNSSALGAHRRVYHNPLGRVVTNFWSHKILTNDTKSFSSPSKITLQESTDAYSPPKRIKLFEDNQVSSTINTLDKTSPNKKPQISDLKITSQPSTNQTKKETPASTCERKLSKVSNPQVLATFPCEFCPKKFSTFSEQKKHTLSHTRPQQCMTCGMRFRTNDEVNKHKAIAHSGGQFQCQLCNCSYNTNFGLRQHVKMIHERQSASFSNVTIENEQDEPAGEQEVLFLQGANADDQTIDTLNIDDESEPILEGFYGTGYTEVLLNKPIVVGFAESPLFEDEKDYSDTEGNENVFQDYAPIIIQEDEYVEESVPEDIPIESLDSIVINNLVTLPALNVSNKTKRGFSPKSRPMKCSACGVTCHGPEKLRQHMESHVDSPSSDTIEENHVKMYKCEKCGLEYKTFLEKAEHLKMDHDDTGQYRCAYCPCTMKTETVLQYHFMKHHSTQS